MFNRPAFAIAVILALVAFASEGPSTREAPTEPSWHKIKSATGNAKNKLTQVKFKVTTKKWRLSIKTAAIEAGKNNPAAGTIRIALLVESQRDVDDLPVNWQQVQIICDGKPGDSGTKIFETGPSEDQKDKWFEVTITGRNSTYEVTVEDQSAGPEPKTKPKKKKD